MRRLRTTIAGSLALLGLLVVGTPQVVAEDPVRLRVVPPMYVGGDGLGFLRPEGVACTADTLVVADTGNARLVRFTIAGERINPVGAVRRPELPYPLRVRLDASGGILVLDGKTRKIERLSGDGTYEGAIEPADRDLADAIFVRSFDVDAAGRVLVLDTLGARVLVLARDGTVRRTVALPADHGFVSDLAVDAKGTVYLVDSVRSRIYVARPREEEASVLVESLGDEVLFPTSLTVDGRGRLWVLDQKGGNVVLLGPDGVVLARQAGDGWRDGLLRYPSGLCLDGSGTLFVADRENNRIHPFLVAE
jgi:sugar lactone lactonase YvrE